MIRLLFTLVSLVATQALFAQEEGLLEFVGKRSTPFEVQSEPILIKIDKFPKVEKLELPKVYEYVYSHLSFKIENQTNDSLQPVLVLLRYAGSEDDIPISPLDRKNAPIRFSYYFTPRRLVNGNKKDESNFVARLSSSMQGDCLTITAKSKVEPTFELMADDVNVIDFENDQKVTLEIARKLDEIKIDEKSFSFSSDLDRQGIPTFLVDSVRIHKDRSFVTLKATQKLDRRVNIQGELRIHFLLGGKVMNAAIPIPILKEKEAKKRFQFSLPYIEFKKEERRCKSFFVFQDSMHVPGIDADVLGMSFVDAKSENSLDTSSYRMEVKQVGFVNGAMRYEVAIEFLDEIPSSPIQFLIRGDSEDPKLQVEEKLDVKFMKE